MNHKKDYVTSIKQFQVENGQTTKKVENFGTCQDVKIKLNHQHKKKFRCTVNDLAWLRDDDAMIFL